MSAMLLSPSILSADWTRLADQVELANRGADWLHLDLMDGHLVPNLTFGPFIVKALASMARIPLDAHLMVDDPVEYAGVIRKAGVEWITIHVEACGVAGPGWPAPVVSRGEGSRATGSDSAGEPLATGPHPIDVSILKKSIAAVRATGAKVGLALRPDTQVSEVTEVLADLDLLLVMSVYPGFSGQSFRAEALDQMKAAARWREEHGASFLIQVDGGVAQDTIARVVEAGVDVVVSGHGVFRQTDPLAAMAGLRKLAQEVRIKT